MKGIALKKAFCMAGFIAALTFFPSVRAYAGGTGVLFTAGAGRKLEMGIFDLVASNEVMGQASAGASTGIDEQALREGQIEETMAGYKNLGIAVVENHL
ncbi:MAG: hypothetical protein IK139_05615, partial [Lachnospiraceae bacterium]|nr:hypothetical protein [Lachnospiraceae bacterium]